MTQWTLSPDIAEVMVPVTHPYSYYVLYGGRAGMRSWTVARVLLVDGVAQPLRILCVRETQKSIKDSVHKLLHDQIKLLGLESFYKVLQHEIRGQNGTEFVFTGLSEHTAHSIKSYEGVDRCWCEEAHTITDRSWSILLPTIRKEGSRVYVTFNPELETDATYRRFIKSPPDDSVIIFTTFKDNPWHSTKSEAERLKCMNDTPDEYEHVWLGKCLPAVKGAIYFKEVRTAQEQNRICPVPYDPMLKVHVIIDLGKGDSLFVAMVQRHLSEIRVIDTIAGNHFNLDTLSQELKERKYNWGRVWLPHDGFTATINAPSSETILLRLGWDVAPRDLVTKLGVEEGIRNTKLKFNQLYFDKTRCNDLVESLKRYRRHIVTTTGAAMGPVHDDASHGADCLRYVCINADNMTNGDTDDDDLDLSCLYNPRDREVGI